MDFLGSKIKPVESQGDGMREMSITPMGWEFGNYFWMMKRSCKAYPDKGGDFGRVELAGKVIIPDESKA